MPQLDKDSEEVKRIDNALSEWRQGDVALEEHWFTHIADPSRALTTESGQAEGGLQAITSEVEGLIIITQSCDIVRSCAKRPFLEFSPLVKVAPLSLKQIERGLRPAYAFVSAIADADLVADLDRVMTVEKAVVSTWKRTQGCKTDVEVRNFAQALARKHARFAFPDEFTLFVSGLQARLREKYDKFTEEGNALRALREIRVRAAPSWDATDVELFFWFIRDETDSDLQRKSWIPLLESWLKLIPANGRFTRVDGAVTLLEDLTARDYVESEPLDLDYLSNRDN